MPLNLESRPSCHTRLNAFSTSRKAAVQYYPSSREDATDHYFMTMVDCGVMGAEAKLVM